LGIQPLRGGGDLGRGGRVGVEEAFGGADGAAVEAGAEADARRVAVDELGAASADVHHDQIVRGQPERGVVADGAVREQRLRLAGEHLQ